MNMSAGMTIRLPTVNGSGQVRCDDSEDEFPQWAEQSRATPPLALQVAKWYFPLRLADETGQDIHDKFAFGRPHHHYQRIVFPTDLGSAAENIITLALQQEIDAVSGQVYENGEHVEFEAIIPIEVDDNMLLQPGGHKWRRT